MHRPQHDATNFRAGTHATFADLEVDVIVLTTNLQLLDLLQESAVPEYVFWPAESAEEAVDLLVSGHCGVLIVDLQGLGAEPAALLERLLAQFPELVLIAVGRREEETSISALVTSGRVYRFLHTPISAPRASLFLSAAARRYAELSRKSSPRFRSVGQIAEPGRRGPFAGIVAAIAALGAIWLLRAPLEEFLAGLLRVPAGSAQNETPQPNPMIATHLEKAREALAAGRLASPQNDSAVEHYRSVLALQSGNAEAKAGIGRVTELLLQQFIEAVQAGDTPRAARAFSALQNADPANPQLDSLQQQLLALSRGQAARM